MDFGKVVQEADKWPDFTLQRSDEEARRLEFVLDKQAFFVVCPGGPGESWQVWSDDDSSVARQAAVQDLLDSSTCSLDRILSKIADIHTSGASASSPKADSGEEEEEEDDDDEEDDIDYYGEDDDLDDLGDDAACASAKDEDESLSADDFFTGKGSKAAVHRLLQDLKNLRKTGGSFGVMGGPRGDNLFVWDVELSGFEDCKGLHKDLVAYSKKYNRQPVVHLEMKFPKDYPMAPPFVRVIRPRFRFLTGHITVGGSVCMEMLTRSGWRPTNDIEGLLVSIRSEIMSDENTHLDSNPDRPYSEEEAKQAFERMVARYGWNK